jgi:hypothetical protein
MKATRNVNIHNKFEIAVTDSRTGEVKQKGTAYNIVLDQMFDRILNFNHFFNFIRFGKGEGTPVASDTSLFDELGAKEAITEEEVREFPVCHRTRYIRLEPEEYPDEIITEVGIAYNPGGANAIDNQNTLVTHAMIEDAEGNPLFVEKTEFDVLTIYATVYFDIGDNSQMHGGAVRWMEPLEENHYIDYLMGNTFSNDMRLRAGSAPHFTTRPIIGQTGASDELSRSEWESDSDMRTTSFPTVRFGTDDANGRINSFAISDETGSGGVLQAVLPIPGFWDGYEYQGQEIGMGNGERRTFRTNDNPIMGDRDIVVRKDNEIINEADYRFYDNALEFPAYRAAFVNTNVMTYNGDYQPFHFEHHPEDKNVYIICGRRLLGGSSSVAVMKLDPEDHTTKLLRNISTDETRYASFTPNGKFLFLHRHNTSTIDIYPVDLDSEEVVGSIKGTGNVGYSAHTLYARFYKDGEKLYWVTANRNGEISAIEIDEENGEIISERVSIQPFSTARVAEIHNGVLIAGGTGADLSAESGIVFASFENGAFGEITRPEEFQEEGHYENNGIQKAQMFTREVDNETRVYMLAAMNDTDHKLTLFEVDPANKEIIQEWLPQENIPFDVYRIELRDERNFLISGEFGDEGELIYQVAGVHMDYDEAELSEAVLADDSTFTGSQHIGAGYEIPIVAFNDHYGVTIEQASQEYRIAIMPVNWGPVNNVILDEAPPQDARISVDYWVPHIPKDDNHVLDVGFTIDYGGS